MSLGSLFGLLPIIALSYTAWGQPTEPPALLHIPPFHLSELFPPSSESLPVMAKGNSWSEAGDNADDPGFSLYKAGYNFILDERWDDARKKFTELISKYPTSEYVDDAEYWSAYSLAGTKSWKEAIDEYRRFLDEYSGSSYYDDAVADLSEAEAHASSQQFPPSLEVMRQHRMAMEQVHRQVREMSLQLRGEGPHASNPPIDPDTELRLAALDALGQGKEDDKSFNTLKEVALNNANPVILREQAINILANFRKFDPLPILVELVKTDTGGVVQNIGIDYILNLDKTKSVDALIDIWHSIPPHRQDQSSHVFYSIAEVGNDKAVDFLTSVAHNHTDQRLRREAVYYLGAIGSEKSRKALYEILKGK